MPAPITVFLGWVGTKVVTAAVSEIASFKWQAQAQFNASAEEKLWKDMLSLDHEVGAFYAQLNSPGKSPEERAERLRQAYTPAGNIVPQLSPQVENARMWMPGADAGDAATTAAAPSRRRAPSEMDVAEIRLEGPPFASPVRILCRSRQRGEGLMPWMSTPRVCRGRDRPTSKGGVVRWPRRKQSYGFWTC